MGPGIDHPEIIFLFPDFAFISTRLGSKRGGWAQVASQVLGARSGKDSPTLTTISDAIRQARGKRKRSLRLLDEQQQAQGDAVEVQVRGQTILMANKTWPLLMEATVANVRWLLSELKKEVTEKEAQAGAPGPAEEGANSSSIGGGGDNGGSMSNGGRGGSDW